MVPQPILKSSSDTLESDESQECKKAHSSKSVKSSRKISWGFGTMQGQLPEYPYPENMEGWIPTIQVGKFEKKSLKHILFIFPK